MCGGKRSERREEGRGRGGGKRGREEEDGRLLKSGGDNNHMYN